MNIQPILLSSILLLSSTQSRGTQVFPHVVGWGQNSCGESTGFLSAVLRADQLPFSTGVVFSVTTVRAVQLSVSDSFCLALHEYTGTATGWGNNYKGRAIGKEIPGFYCVSGRVTVNNVLLTNLVAVAAGGNFGLGLKWDGTVLAWGENIVPDGLTNVVRISARGSRSLAVRMDGTVVGWNSVSDSKRPQLHILKGLTNVTSVAVGGDEIALWNTALKKDGTIAVWRDDPARQEVVPVEFSHIKQIAVGRLHTLALRDDGTLLGFGCDREGQATGVPTKQALEDKHLSWGFVKVGGQLATNVSSVSAYGNYSMAVVASKVVMWGDKGTYHEPPAGLHCCGSVAAGPGFCLALTTCDLE
jgi:alpha-tubulin suppressor-like RCC1 family protein